MESVPNRAHETWIRSITARETGGVPFADTNLEIFQWGGLMPSDSPITEESQNGDVFNMEIQRSLSRLKNWIIGLRDEPHGMFGLHIAVERKILTYTFFASAIGGGVISIGGIFYQFKTGDESITWFGLGLFGWAYLLAYTWGTEI